MSVEAIVFFDLLGRPISKDELKVFESRLWAQSHNQVEPGTSEEEPTMLLFKGQEHFTYFDQYTARGLLKTSTDFNDLAWQKVKKYSWVFRLVPFIKMVAVCNTLAFGSSKAKSDIDFFIITARNRMFSARLILTFLCQILGIRRHGKNISQRFCLSFFVSEEDMKLSPILLQPLDAYMLFWMRSLKVLFGRDMLEHFIGENSWYKKFFPEMTESHFKFSREKSWLTPVQKFLEKILSGRLGNFIERKLENWQIKRASDKKSHLPNASGTVISHSMLKFHDNDRREEFLDKWQKGLK